MCETSEPGERLILREDILPISLDIGRRILEIFGYQKISAIVFRLRSTRREIDDVINGEKLPSAELLLGIKKATGASIDWILTGDGSRFIAEKPTSEQRRIGRTVRPIDSMRRETKLEAVPLTTFASPALR